MYIEPNTNIILLKNVPISNNYKDTLWFDNKTAQENYFKSLKLFDLKNYSYQRVNLGVTRVGIDAEKLYCCNYMMFQNASFGNKWFYAFVTKVEYVNNGMSHVYFEIDVMQTWLFDYTLKECFVEREHSKTDAIGDNIVAESLGTDEYVVNKEMFRNFTETQLFIYATGLPGESTENGVTTPTITAGNVDISYGIFNGMTIYQRVLSEDNLEEINRILSSYIDKGLEDAIILIQQMPYFCGRPSQSEVPKQEFRFPMKHDTIDGYTPKNNKLFTYPYNFLIVSNNAGYVDQYQFELFDNPLDTYFTFYGVPISTPIIACVPKNYRNVIDDYDNAITLSNFPQCAWSGDAFKAWYCQNKGNIAAGYDTRLNTGNANVIGSFFSSINPVKNISNMVGSATDTLVNTTNYSRILEGQIQDAKAKPNNVHGKIQCESLNVALDKVGFNFKQMCLHSEHARSIDNYFTMYGYATKKVKIPNRNVRPHFTYTKTEHCTIVGSMPSDDISKICAIYDRGIRFWKNGANVGNYSLDNRPV